MLSSALGVTITLRSPTMTSTIVGTLRNLLKIFRFNAWEGVKVGVAKVWKMVAVAGYLSRQKARFTRANASGAVSEQSLLLGA